jgi:hypothetical protein
VYVWIIQPKAQKVNYILQKTPHSEGCSVDFSAIFGYNDERIVNKQPKGAAQ